MKLIIILLLLTSPLMAQKHGINVVNDLRGHTATSKDGRATWTFQHNEKLNAVVVSDEDIGIDYILHVYVLSFDNSNVRNKVKAEGKLAITYRKELLGTHKLTGIKNEGFLVSPIDDKKYKELVELYNFWDDFKHFIQFEQVEKVASMFNFPFHVGNYTSYNNKKEFMQNYDLILNSAAIESAQYCILVPYKDTYCQKFHYKHIFTVNGKTYYFVVKKVNGKFKIIAINKA